MKNLLTLVILLFPTLYGWADEENTVKKTTDAHITGHIILKETGEHLPFMTILLKGTNIGTATDETGHFFLKNLPEGKYTLHVQGVGYKSAEKEIVIVRGKTQEVNFEISEDAVMLDGAVVTANRNETDRREAPVIVNVLSPKVFENTNSVCLSQGLNFQPGLRVENNCQNCGFQQVRINGLDGPYSQILIDSRPMCSSLAGVYGLEQIPANMVERVEVLRGGGSALFGSNAIAGTINIITKEPLYNFFQVGHTLSAIDGESFDNVTSFNGAIVNDQRDAGIYLFGMVRDRQAYDHDDDGFSELGKINSTTLGFKTYYKPTHFSKFTLEYHHIKEFRRGGNNLIRYNPIPDLSLRASYSEGFRAPQTYDEDLHVAAVGGEVTLIQVAKDLKTERSRSYSASVDYYTTWGPVQINLLLEGFYTSLHNPFVLEEIESDDENKILERRNGSDAVVKGFNLEGKIAPHKSVQLQFGATLQSSKYDEPVAWSKDPDVEACRKLLRSPDQYGYATLNLLPFKNFSAALSGTYTGSMYVGHSAGYIEKDVLEKTDSFFDATIKLAYDIKVGRGYTIQFNIGMQNVFDSYQNDFDKGEFRDSGYIYGPGLPRTYFAGLKFGIF